MELSDLEKTIIEFATDNYINHPYIDVTCSQTGKEYLLTWNKYHGKPNDHHFTLYIKKEEGFDIVETHKIIEEKSLYTQLLFNY